MKPTYASLIFSICLALCCLPVVGPPLALALGLIVASTSGNPFAETTGKWVGFLLKASVIGLGFGINGQLLIETGRQSLLLTAGAVVVVLLAGMVLGRWLKVESKIALLIAAGTAICGGSAVAAVGTAIDADSRQLSVSTGTIFMLNAVALFLFPVLGQWLGLSQEQFGLWSAIAIHDTSSVVGAAARYGDMALHVATTTKMVRVLWIIPVAFLSALPYWQRGTRVQFPYFIFLFVAASLVRGSMPDFGDTFVVLYRLARQGLVVSLFLIGAGLSLKTIRSVGPKPLLQGVILWLLTSAVSLLLIR